MLEPSPNDAGTPDRPLSPIAVGNDTFRKALCGTPAYPGQLIITSGVLALHAATCATALQRIRGFAAFEPENDPYGDHDFGAMEVDGVKLFWKFDYYEDMACDYGAENPARHCYRIMTVMLAQDY